MKRTCYFLVSIFVLAGPFSAGLGYFIVNRIHYLHMQETSFYSSKKETIVLTQDELTVFTHRKNELKINGRMFDVVAKRKLESGRIELLVVHDSKEQRIAKSYLSYLRTSCTNKNRINSSRLLVQFTSMPFIPVHTSNDWAAIEKELDKNGKAETSNLYLQPYIKSLSPPPKTGC